jgi:prepilin-type N-terminal cleavage/methylation domain-containing protein
VKRKLRAFTLIELLVVIAIIALLISILLPSLSRARELSKRLVCASNIKGVGTSAKIYANDNNERWMVSPFSDSAYDPRASDGRHPTRSDVRSVLTAGPCSNSLVPINGFPVVHRSPDASFRCPRVHGNRPLDASAPGASLRSSDSETHPRGLRMDPQPR